MKYIIEKLKLAIPIAVYMVIYLVWFFVLESKITTYTLIHTSIDDKIPFCEFFVIPYFLWFGYVALTVVVALFTDEQEYRKSLVFLITGMTIFLIISTLWPNGHNLRPLDIQGKNLCCRLVAGLYRTDTPTNLWPSIHVYNSIGAHLCVSHCSATKDKKVIRIGSFILCVSIIFSTMLIKQHSFFDVCTAFLMALLMGIIVYRTELIESIHESIKDHENHVSLRKA
ncbi:MAG: phosphatase PAP2 family protein [Lachnospiraceae bacterium]|nr:phosphatase PAP2 family protein [Lachnospiraceae bacterium]